MVGAPGTVWLLEWQGSCMANTGAGRFQWRSWVSQVSLQWFCLNRETNPGFSGLQQYQHHVSHSRVFSSAGVVLLHTVASGLSCRWHSFKRFKSNHYTLYLKHIQCCVLIISQGNWKGKKNEEPKPCKHIYNLCLGDIHYCSIDKLHSQGPDPRGLKMYCNTTKSQGKGCECFILPQGGIGGAGT